MRNVVLRTISFDPQGVTFEYYELPDDVRGGMVRNHALRVPLNDTMSQLQRDAEQTLGDALENFERVEVDEGPDEPGPYDNPEER